MIKTASISSCRAAALAAALCLAAAFAGSAGAETRVGGKITGVQTWDKSGNPYVVNADITIPKGASLRVGPGVEILFKPDINDREGANAFDLEVLVEGELLVNGAEGDTVVFSSTATAPRWTDWQGIVIRGPSARAELKVTQVHYANEGVKVIEGSLAANHLTVSSCNQYGLYFIGGRGVLTDVLVTDIANSGGNAYGISLDRGADFAMKNSFVVGAQNGILFSRSSTGNLENTVVTLCSGPGVLVHNSTPTITRCTITGNTYGILASAGSRPVVHQNNIFENGVNLWLKEYGEERVELDFTNNWWGVTELSLVEDGVSDGVDDPVQHVFAIISPFLTEPTTNEAKERSGP